MSPQHFSPYLWDTKFTYRWVIKKFIYQTFSLSSKIFPQIVGTDSKWYLELKPGFFGENESVDVCLYLHSAKRAKAKILLSLDLSDKDGNVIVAENVPDVILLDLHSETSRKFELCSLIQREALLGAIKDHGEALVVNCEIKTFSPDLDEEGSAEPESGVKRQYDWCHGDVTIVSADNKELKIHSAVLSAQPEALSSKLKTAEGGNGSGPSFLSEFDYETLNALRFFLYGKTISDDKLEDKVKLLLAADRYDLLEVKLALEDSFIGDVTVENALDLIVLADCSAFYRLKTCLMRLICSNEARHLLDTTQWIELVAVHPHIMQECFVYLLEQKANYDVETEITE